MKYVAQIPKIKENELVNNFILAFFLSSLPSLSSENEKLLLPDKYAKYNGIIGKTQGDKNDNKPAKKTAIVDTLISVVKPGRAAKNKGLLNKFAK